MSAELNLISSSSIIAGTLPSISDPLHPAAVERSKIDKYLSRRPVIVSKTTATYDKSGAYPAMKLFQIAKPVPEPRIFGIQLSNISDKGKSMLLFSSYRTKKEETIFLNQLV